MTIQFHRGSASQLQFDVHSTKKNDKVVKDGIQSKETKQGNSSPRRISTSNIDKDNERAYIKKVFYKDPVKSKSMRQNVSVLSKSTNEFKKV